MPILSNIHFVLHTDVSNPTPKTTVLHLNISNSSMLKHLFYIVVFAILTSEILNEFAVPIGYIDRYVIKALVHGTGLPITRVGRRLRRLGQSGTSHTAIQSVCLPGSDNMLCK